MELSINTPALLFPAITLLMLAYTNRYLALGTLIRHLHGQYKEGLEGGKMLKEQIRNLKSRLLMIRRMQALGVLSFFFCVLCMTLMFLGYPNWAGACFAVSLVLLLFSLVLSFAEIIISTRALEIELSDMGG
jgi:hypothetical protein